MNAPVSVVEALSAVMEDVQGIRKGDTNTQQGYKFRGIDAVVNAVGPSFRKHGVVCVPIGVEWASEHYTTAKGTPMRGITVTITFRFYGPAGDFIDAQACGEAADSGDKAMPKAHSVAYRTLLLQALCIPTDEPDPDSESHERAASAPAGTQEPTTQVGAGAEKTATEPQRNLMVILTDKLVAAGKLDADQAETLRVAAGDPSTSRDAASKAIERLRELEKK